MPTDTSKPKPPRSESQREAARRNGAKSKGSVTAEAKQTSALNSIWHGLRSEKTVFDNESVADFEDFRETIVQRFQPADKLELDLCLEMAHARWRLQRTRQLWDLNADLAPAGPMLSGPCTTAVSRIVFGVAEWEIENGSNPTVGRPGRAAYEVGAHPRKRGPHTLLDPAWSWSYEEAK